MHAPTLDGLGSIYRWIDRSIERADHLSRVSRSTIDGRGRWTDWGSTSRLLEDSNDRSIVCNAQPWTNRSTLSSCPRRLDRLVVRQTSRSVGRSVDQEVGRWIDRSGYVCAASWTADRSVYRARIGAMCVRNVLFEIDGVEERGVCQSIDRSVGPTRSIFVSPPLLSVDQPIDRRRFPQFRPWLFAHARDRR